MKAKKAEQSPLDRIIVARERGIARMEQRIKDIQAKAAADVEAIKERIAEKRVLLDAVKRGALKP